MKNAIETTKLRNGVKVYARTDKRFGLNAVSYCNLTQANKAQIKLQALGIDCYVGCGYPFYIVIKSDI